METFLINKPDIIIEILKIIKDNTLFKLGLDSLVVFLTQIKKTIKNTKNLEKTKKTLFFHEIFKKILITSLEYMISGFIKEITPILRTSYEIFTLISDDKELLVDILKAFNEIAEFLGLKLYENTDYFPILFFFKGVFCLTSPDQIENLAIYEKSFNYLYNACLKRLFPVKTNEKLLIYAYLFPESQENLLKLQKLTESITIVKIIERKLTFIKENYFFTIEEYQEFVLELEKGLIAIPFYTSNNDNNSRNGLISNKKPPNSLFFTYFRSLF